VPVLPSSTVRAPRRDADGSARLSVGLDGGAQTVVGEGRRHAHVDHGDVRAVLDDRVDQRRGVPDGGDDVAAGLAEQAHQPFAQQHRVLGQHYPHGTTASTLVPPP